MVFLQCCDKLCNKDGKSAIFQRFSRAFTLPKKMISTLFLVALADCHNNLLASVSSGKLKSAAYLYSVLLTRVTA